MLLPVMITKIILLCHYTNESTNCNGYNNNDVLTIKIIITQKTKNSCA